jgi:hypothetical protein
MTFGPDDLPEDPFGDGGQAMVACACTAETFHLVLTAAMAKVICPDCHQVQAQFARAADVGPHHGWPGQGDITAARDMLDLPPTVIDRPGVWHYDPGTGTVTHAESGHTVQAGWDTGPPQPPAPWTDVPPLLPHFRPGQCTVRFSGGPYAGQSTWVMPDATLFGIAGAGVYRDTGRIEDGLRVFAWQPQ